jgi:cation:H+ antiporter
LSALAVTGALVAGAAAVALGAQMFTNAVEWLGFRLRLGDRVLGGVVAAWGTALPETAVPLVAVLGVGAGGGAGGDATHAAHAVGVGAILGAPFLLATVAFALLGATIVLRRRRGGADHLVVAPRGASADLTWFVALFAVALAASAPPFRPHRLAVVPILVGGYAVYLAVTLRGGRGVAARAPDRLALWRVRQPPALAAVGVVAAVALALLVAGAQAFVVAVTGLGHLWALPQVLLAVVLAPLATELPEVTNSVLWAWRGRDDLALSAVTGAMIIQSAIGPSLGIALTPWALGPTEWFAAALALAAAVFFALGLRLYRRLDAPPLLFGAAFYALFLAVMATASA